MLHLITDSIDLAKHQHAFQELLYKHLYDKLAHNFGHLGANFVENVHTNGNLWFFSKLAGEPEPNRYWNAFGLFSTEEPSNIAVEINFPIEGTNRRIAGLLARDDRSNQVKVLHRGGIGGGRKGIGKNAFRSWYRKRFPNNFVDVDEGMKNPIESILIGPIGESSLITNLEIFVKSVADFKAQSLR